MAEPVSLLALGVSAGALGLQGITATRRLYDDKKKPKQQQQSSPPFYLNKTEISSQTIGSGQVIQTSDGTVIAGGKGPGDFTFGTVTTTRMLSLGSGKHSQSQQSVSELMKTANSRSNASPMMPLLFMQQAQILQSQQQQQQQLLQQVPQRQRLVQQPANQQSLVGWVEEIDENPPAYSPVQMDRSKGRKMFRRT